MSDNVEKPAHYNQGSVETIDGIRAALGVGFLAYCLGNVLKYVWRCQSKGNLLEDLRKAAKYLQWAIAEAEKLEPKSDAGNSLEIPEGWRELEQGEPRKKTDRFWWAGGWVGYIDGYDPEGSVCAKYDRKTHLRHIRKIEPTNSSETPNTSTCDKKLGAKLDSGQWCWHDGQMWNCCRSQNEPVNPPETPKGSIPDPGEGYRLLSKDPPEKTIQGDEFYDWDGFWREAKNHKNFKGVQTSDIYYRRKIEPNSSEIPNSSKLNTKQVECQACGLNTSGKTWCSAQKPGCQMPDHPPVKGSTTEPETVVEEKWVPKVGDRVRVVKRNLLVSNMECIVTSETCGTYHVTSILGSHKAMCMLPEHLEPIEAAK